MFHLNMMGLSLTTIWWRLSNMQFWDTEPTKPEFDYDLEKKKFIENMDYLSSMSVEEQTLYKK